MQKIQIVLPNVHAYQFDYSKFPAFNIRENNEVGLVLTGLIAKVVHLDSTDYYKSLPL